MRVAQSALTNLNNVFLNILHLVDLLEKNRANQESDLFRYLNIATEWKLKAGSHHSTELAK